MDKTLAKGLSILEALVDSEGPQGVSEIARRLQLSKSNTHRLLQTLAALGYVDSADGRYAVTPKLGVLGAGVMARLDVRRLALPELEGLARLTRETVHLSILDEDEVVYIEKIDSPEPVRAYTKIGGRAPAWCVATGKALLAYQPRECEARVAARLRAYSPYSITEPASLRRELERIRQRGFALNRGEWREDVGGIGAPIVDSRGDVVAALGISGPTVRLDAAAMDRFAPFVVAAANRVSAQMGASVAIVGDLSAGG